MKSPEEADQQRQEVGGEAGWDEGVPLLEDLSYLKS